MSAHALPRVIPVVPVAPTRRDPTHWTKLLKQSTDSNVRDP